MAAPLRTSCITGIHRAIKIFYPFNFFRSIRSETVSSLLMKQPDGEEINVKGWVRGIQGHKGVTFLHLTDGSGPQHLQVVVPDTVPKNPDITFGSCVEAKGMMTKSLGAGQSVELLTSSVEVIGHCNAFEFPFKQRHHHPPQYARDYLHLRPKTSLFSSLLRIRNSATMAIHQFFQPLSHSEGHDDYEPHWEDGGTGPPQSDQSDSESESNCTQHFFRSPAYLTVSGQLHLEVMAGAMRKVYNFGPTFRAENSKSNFHLSEFYMVEAELAFTESLKDLLCVMENLVKSVYETVMEDSAEDVELYSKYVASPGFRKIVDRMMQSHFKRISYTEAIDILQSSKQDFEFQATWGQNLKKEHEIYITKVMGNVPVFVTDYPQAIKPFYSRKNEDSRTVAACDLLLPGIGELCGSSLREERYEVLKQEMETQGLTDQMLWYLDLRRFGTCPHGGFGLGFERMLMAFLGAYSVRDVIPFPRWPGRCHA